MTSPDGQDVRKSLETLAEVSRDLDRHTQLSKTATHPIQAQQVRKRIDELTAQQTSLMNELVDKHPNLITKQKFKKLTDDLEQLRRDIRACENKDELPELESQIEDMVNKWVHQFQVIVSQVSGVTPPPKPIFD